MKAKQSILINFFFFLGIFSAFGQESDSFARLKLVKQFHDFGDVKEGMLVKTKFQIISEGAVPIWISSIERVCGCTTPKWPKDPIEKGDTAVIEVWFNTENREGPFTKTLRIISNNQFGEVPISITGNILSKKD